MWSSILELITCAVNINVSVYFNKLRAGFSWRFPFDSLFTYLFLPYKILNPRHLVFYLVTKLLSLLKLL